MNFFQLWKREGQRLYKQQYRVRKQAMLDIHRERAKTTNMSRAIVDRDSSDVHYGGGESAQTSHGSTVFEGVSLPEGDME